MTTRPREHTGEVGEDEAVVGCLDVLRGASALVARHKTELAGLLERREPRERGWLERLAVDLTEMLDTTGSSLSQRRQLEEATPAAVAGAAEGGSMGRGAAQEASGGKRAKAREERAAPQAGRGRQEERGASSAMRDAVGLAEVVEHVMSFAEGREMLGRLSRVCRLWRRVSEREGLCLPVVERHMPDALVKQERGASLHGRLGGSARRCLLVHNASLTSGRLLCSKEENYSSPRRLERLVGVLEIFHGDRALCVYPGQRCDWSGDDGEEGLTIYVEASPDYDRPFSAASLGVATLHDVFTGGLLWARFCLMDPSTGVTACLYKGQIVHQGELDIPEPEQEYLGYTTGPLPVTSMTYAGPPLQARLNVFVEPCELTEGDDLEILPLQSERSWRFTGFANLTFTGQPSIYGERFIRTRLAEEAAAAKQHGSG